VPSAIYSRKSRLSDCFTFPLNNPLKKKISINTEK
jgi:hypothetical protein